MTPIYDALVAELGYDPLERLETVTLYTWDGKTLRHRVVRP